MTIWIDPFTQHFGVEPKTGYDGAENRDREFTVDPDIHFEDDGRDAKNGMIEAVEFGPEGTPATSSIESVRLMDRLTPPSPSRAPPTG